MLYTSKMKKVLLLAIIIFSVQDIAAQDFSIGLEGGLYNFGFSVPVSVMTYSFGLNTEYTPPESIFALSASIQYLFEQMMVLVPISLSLVFGEKIRPRVIGGILPVLRINPMEPNVPIGIGAMVGLGLDFKINNKIAITSELGWYFVPYRTYNYNHFSSPDIYKDIERLRKFSLGVKYNM
jgi:hypothetical protein